VTTRALLRAAGLLAWVFAGIPAARGVVREETCSTVGGALTVFGWAAAFVVFGIAFFRATRSDIDEKRVIRLVALQTICALVMNVLLCTGFEAALLVVVTVQTALVLPPIRGLVWVAAQSVGVFVLAAHHMGTTRTIYFIIAVVGLEAFAFTIAAMAGREAAARQALEKTNAELEATREELARASRRELHDLLGHDMIALHLELETARHMTEGRARESVDRAHEIGQTLLGDLREAVSTLRESRASADSPAVDVAAGVRAVVARVQEPRVHLDTPPSLDLGDRERATTVVRCVQEIVTNALKHASAQNLWITLAERDGRIELEARDDGRGSHLLRPGNGLAGMKERVTSLGGELVLETTEGAGFRVRAVLPTGASP
jgi:signal transduction histidine kinase